MKVEGMLVPGPDSSAAVPRPRPEGEDEGTRGLPLPPVGPRLVVPATDLRCPAGHPLRVPAQYVVRRALFCPQCRKAFAPDVAAVKAAEKAIRVGLPRKKFAFPLKLFRRPVAAAAAAARTAETAPQAPLPVSARTFAGMIQASSWTVSCAVHGALLLAVCLLAAKVQPPPRDSPVVLTARLLPADEPRPFDQPRRRALFTADRARDASENPVPLPEIREPDATAAADPDRLPEPTPSADALELPAGMAARTRSAAPAVMGAGASEPGAPGDAPARLFKDRASAPARLAAARRAGGGEDTESAVGKALEWLAAHQRPDGSWRLHEPDERRVIYQRTEAGVVRAEVPVHNDYWRSHDLACTGLAALAFLGAGCDQRAGRHRETVAKALDYIVGQQTETGCWSERPESQEMHVQGILALALAEAVPSAPAGERGEPLRRAAQRAADFAAEAQYPYSVWGYTPFAVRRSPEGKPAAVAARLSVVEQSVTIWNGMALKAARTAGLRLDGQSFAGIGRWLDESRRPDGWYAYSGTYNGSRVLPGNDGQGRPAMAAAALMMRLWTGGRPEEPAQQKTAGLVTGYLESYRRIADAVDGRNPARSAPDLYFLHHGSIALFQVGGEHWRRWNELMKPMVLGSQAEDGSWPAGGYAQGPAMATALGALILESYYRYSPLYR